jgi:hypothetical protein
MNKDMYEEPSESTKVLSCLERPMPLHLVVD